MPFLLARLGQVTGPGERVVVARKAREAQAVSAELMALPVGAVVLLRCPGPPWTGGTKVTPGRWPEGVPEVAALWEARTGRRSARLGPRVRSHGTWVVDARGVACEVGRGEVDGRDLVLLNYAGWRFGDFPDGPVEVVECASEVGVVWIVTPEAVPAPAAEPVASPWTAQAPLRASAPPVGWTPSAPAPAPPAPPPSIARRLRFVDLEFSDGAVAWWLGGRRVVVPCETARAVHEAVKDLLDAELPEGVRFEGRVHAGGTLTGEVRGLERLAEVFERVRLQVFVRTSVAAAEWLDADELAARRPGGAGRREPADLLDIDAFGFGPRADAFRRLFAHRDRAEPVRMLPGRALVVPLPAGDGGGRWYAWETVEDDHATYLFRPPDGPARERMLAWTQRRAAKRRELLEDAELQAELGFVRRVMHHDARGEQLASWWRRLGAVVGLPADEGDGGGAGRR